MISPALQEEITAAVYPAAVVEAHTMWVVGIEPARRDSWRVWVFAPGEQRLQLFLVMLRSNAGRRCTFDVQYAFNIAVIHTLREWYAVPSEREVHQFIYDYGRWLGVPALHVSEVSVLHPLFDTTDRLWVIQWVPLDQDTAERAPTLAWLHDDALYLASGWSSLLETLLFP